MLFTNIRRKKDGTFIVDFNGLPFHVCPEYPEESLYGKELTYDYIKAYAESNPNKVTEYIEPDNTEHNIPEEVLKEQHISQLESNAKLYSSYINAGMDVDYYRQKLVDTLLELEECKGNI